MDNRRSEERPGSSPGTINSNPHSNRRMHYGHSNNNNNNSHRSNQNPNNNNNNRGGGAHHHHHRHHRFDRPQHDHSSGGGSRDGFRPMDDTRSGGGGHSMPFSARKRPLPLCGPRDNIDNNNYAKLYVAPIPRRATEDDIRSLFEDHGNVFEVFFIKDKLTGKRQDCCFIKYTSFEDADRAIRALDNQYTFPGGLGPIKVRYAADKERNRPRYFPDVAELKLYVAELHKQATEEEIEEIFSPYGRIEDILILRDEMNQSKGRGFVEFSNRDMAVAAINALHGTYVMTGCNQPLTVRFAIPKRPKAGDSRIETAFRGSGFGHRVHSSQGFRPGSNHGAPNSGPIQSNSWQKMSPQSLSPSSQAPDFANRSIAKTGAVPVPTTLNSRPPKIEVPDGGQLLPLEKPLHPSLQLPPSLQLQTLEAPVPSQMHSSPVSTQNGLQIPASIGHGADDLPSQHSSELATQTSTQTCVPQFHTQLRTSVAAQTEVASTSSQQKHFLLDIQPELRQSLQESPNQLAQVLAQEESEKTLSQVQPQLHQIQQSSQNPTQEQKSEDAKLQSAHSAARTTATSPHEFATSTASSFPSHTLGTALQNFEWSEHTCPDGFTYYYNCITKESRWEKPTELIRFEHRQRKHSLRDVEVQRTAQKMIIPATSVY